MVADGLVGDYFAALELVKKALHQSADEKPGVARENLRRAMSETGRDLNKVSALTGLSVGTIRGFLRPASSGPGTGGEHNG